MKLPNNIVRRVTEDAIEHVHEWFYEQLGGDPDALYLEIADRQGLDLELESALKLIDIRPPDQSKGSESSEPGAPQSGPASPSDQSLGDTAP